MISKICSRCKVDKLAENFRQEKRVINGLTSWCKSCEKDYRSERKEKTAEDYKIYYEKNRLHLLDYQKTYYINNSDLLKEKSRLYYKENLDIFIKYRNDNSDKIKLAAKIYRTKNKDKIAKYQKAYFLVYKILNKNKLAQNRKEYYYANSESNRLKISIYRKMNRPKFNVRNALRRSAKLNRTPSWLTEADHTSIMNFYDEAKLREIETGTKFHVDHIIPLQGDTVCGLHVPWNLQVITAYENLSKGNKLL
jgi:predicted RND superfamily exporter protein